jgi:hypothetical protein
LIVSPENEGLTRVMDGLGIIVSELSADGIGDNVEVGSGEREPPTVGCGEAICGSVAAALGGATGVGETGSGLIVQAVSKSNMAMSISVRRMVIFFIST